MKNTNFVGKWSVLITLLVITFLGARMYWTSLLSAPDPKDTQLKVFIISPGEPTPSIVGRLEKEGLVKSAWAFNVFLKRAGRASAIQTGEFKLSPSMDAGMILQALTLGRIGKWVTLLEGWRVEEMATKLNTELGVSSEEFIKAAKEGYMFPDTYLFEPDVTALEIVSTMENNFDKKYGSELQGKIRKLGLSPDQGVILASIVEREARSDEARRMVASILLKRLKVDMGLNTDATIQYALVPRGAKNLPADGWWKRHLTKDDLKINSPYNTYLYKGLPPTPISSPSLSSLQAVANADPSTPYLYYYHDSQGKSHYAKTLDEHNENIARYP